MEGRFLLNIVVRKSSAVLKLFSGKDKALLVWWDAFLVLNFILDTFDRVCWFDIQSYCFTR